MSSTWIHILLFRLAHVPQVQVCLIWCARLFMPLIQFQAARINNQHQAPVTCVLCEVANERTRPHLKCWILCSPGWQIIIINAAAGAMINYYYYSARTPGDLIWTKCLSSDSTPLRPSITHYISDACRPIIQTNKFIVFCSRYCSHLTACHCGCDTGFDIYYHTPFCLARNTLARRCTHTYPWFMASYSI
jgi:hypothetical protein